MEQDDTVVYDLSDFTKLREEGKFNNEKKSPLVNPVREYNLDGEFIRMWNSINQVATAFGVSYSTIHSCIRGKRLSVKGRIFLQSLDKIEDRVLSIQKEKERQELIKSAEEEYKKTRQINVYTSSGEFLRSCYSISEASRVYAISKGSIESNLRGQSSVTNGLCFLRSDEDITNRLKKIKKRKTHKKNL
jgi:predicted DNA-binding protein YlxM (UPF0122 family)